MISPTYQPGYIVAALAMIPVVLLARLFSVGAPATTLWALSHPVKRPDVFLPTWGGLRGAVSVALALSLPGGKERDLLLAATHAVVTFSILAQGTTLSWALKRLLPPADADAVPPGAAK